MADENKIKCVINVNKIHGSDLVRGDAIELTQEQYDSPFWRYRVLLQQADEQVEVATPAAKPTAKK